VTPVIEFFQQNTSLFVVLGAVATILGFAFTIYKSAHDRQVRHLREEIRQKEHEIAALKREGNGQFKAVTERLQKELDESKATLKKHMDAARSAVRKLQNEHTAAAGRWKEAESAWRAKYDRLQETVGALTTQLEAAREDLASRDQAERARANLLRRAMKLEGKVWERRVLQGVPRFRPLAERHTAIIAILNLKGGVGKTTVAAHLGAALSAKGYRALLLDLDLQGSLSSLFVNESLLRERSDAKLLLQHFLTRAAERHKPNLLDYCVPIFDGKSAVVTNADSMAYAELNLTMQWLLRLGKRDTRFLLRKALQQKRVTRRFDVVLLDCPPLFNTCCVNALAASDYIVIPVVPSRKAVERVPLLLERIHGLHRVLNPELAVMGVVMNRTHASTLTAWEQDLWAATQEHSQDRWKLPIHAFETVIRQTTEVRDSETEFSPPAPGSELHTVFSRIAAELEARLPRDCRRIATAPLGPG
jgi:cellulose biosynthesis protein BcsQ